MAIHQGTHSVWRIPSLAIPVGLVKIHGAFWSGVLCREYPEGGLRSEEVEREDGVCQVVSEAASVPETYTTIWTATWTASIVPGRAPEPVG